MRKIGALILALNSLPAFVFAVDSEYSTYYGDENSDGICVDPLGYDSKLEVVHLYKNEWPAGLAVSSTGRIFSSYAAGLDPYNVNDGRNSAYQVAELIGFDREKPYPNAEYNNPPGGAIDYTKNPPVTKGYTNYLLAVNALYMDRFDNLYMLDSGRARTKGPIILPASGGTKVVVVSLKDNSIKRTYTFPPSVAKPNSYFFDLRVDLPHGVIYISDATNSLDNAIVVLDLKTGESWRVLEQDPTLQMEFGGLPFIWGDAMYDNGRNYSNDIIINFIGFGVEGLAVCNNSNTLYYSIENGRTLYSVPIPLLLDPYTPPSEVSSAVVNHGEKGTSIGLACDSNGIVWSGNAENDGMSMYDPTTGRTIIYVRDKRINWVFSISIGMDGYLYFLPDQLNYYPGIFPGYGPLFVDRRKKPFVLFRFKLPNGATRAD